MSKFLFAFFSLLLLVACREDEPIDDRVRSRTVVIYQAAQNSLGYTAKHRQDSIEMMAGVKYLREGERVLLFTDDDRHARLYLLAKGFERPQLLRQWSSEINSADAATVGDVLEYAASHYPADDYGLVLWSHATGWIPSGKSVAKGGATSAKSGASGMMQESATPLHAEGRRKPQSFGIDVGEGGDMAREKTASGGLPDEIDIDALATALNSSGVHLRYILFDCCLMQCVEVAYALRGTTDYIAASPMAISADGADYTKLFEKGLFAKDIADIGRTYVAHYRKLYETKQDDFGVVFSVVKTSGLQELATALAQVLPPLTRQTDGTPVYWDMRQSQAYAPFVANFFYRPYYHDMNDALRRHLSTTAYARVKSALDAVVIYRGATPRFYSGPTYYDYIDVDLAHYCGMSMFVPQADYDYAAAYSVHGNLNSAFRRTAWYAAAGWKAGGW